MDITIDFWHENVDRILDFQDKKTLTNAGSISKAQMEKQVSEIYASFDKRRRKFRLVTRKVITQKKDGLIRPSLFLLSGERRGSNPRPPEPQSGALTN